MADWSVAASLSVGSLAAVKSIAMSTRTNVLRVGAGVIVGKKEGAGIGTLVGRFVGARLGKSVGAAVGDRVGAGVGTPVGP